MNNAVNINCVLIVITCIVYNILLTPVVEIDDMYMYLRFLYSVFFAVCRCNLLSLLVNPFLEGVYAFRDFTLTVIKMKLSTVVIFIPCT